MARRTKDKVWKKPFEGCFRLDSGKFTDKGFHDISDEDDERFSRILKRLKAK